MNCERVTQLTPDYLQGSLPHDDAAKLEEHFAQCAACNETVTLWNSLGLLPEEQPSPVLRARIEGMIRAYREAPAVKFAPARKSRSFAWFGIDWARFAPMAVGFAALMLAVGYFAGHSGARQAENATTTNSNAQIAAMQTELNNVRQLMIVSMLQQQSASERLQGVSYTAQDQQFDPKVIGALLHTLRADSSVDVRIAALNALSRVGAQQPQIRQGLIDALQPQQSPLVQVALIDQLVELKDRSAVNQIQKMREQPNVNPAVKERAEWALAKLQ